MLFHLNFHSNPVTFKWKYARWTMNIERSNLLIALGMGVRITINDIAHMTEFTILCCLNYRYETDETTTHARCRCSHRVRHLNGILHEWEPLFVSVSRNDTAQDNWLQNTGNGRCKACCSFLGCIAVESGNRQIRYSGSLQLNSLLSNSR